MVDIFVNYRTGDEENVAALLEHELSQRFESGVFFRASKSIRLGDNYEEALPAAVRKSAALLSVIGPRWLDVHDEQGRRKIDNESDWTRREILEAFHCRIRVIPVLVGTARPLSANALPAELSELAVCQYARLRHRDVDDDLDGLADELGELIPDLRGKRAVAPESGGTVNNAFDQAQVGFQGNVTGNVDLRNFGRSRDDRDGR
jgi:TIR domain